ncbi:lytic murein transglycosylase [Thermosulfurimonas dismutans]|uniref:Membrane-bound lytic murein transglycosylase B n=1 Tax=Thermosulfurimonas dismutans TaxID=999894 RepID=A0A179D559_9BACT|nr:lytic murein transglycosylase [Thermosulfurimonas dismutans]OAQ21230.1 Membrane-bound lytic murein transglycosylase B precursor [Thermosulfurimonas dismutans]
MRLTLGVCLILTVVLTVCPARAKEDTELFAELKSRLMAEGFSPAEIDKVFSDPRVKFLPQIMPRKLTWDESKLPYKRFLRPERIARARNFMKDYAPLLDEIEKTYGVEKEVLVALLLVESDLGRHHGRYEIFNVLASMAVSSDWERVKPYLDRELSPEEEARLKSIMARRSRWAYRELVVLLEISQKYGLDPLALKGSIFGAFGYPQFIPSSFRSYAVDGDGDGRIDLYTLTDALASAANYLKRHGWRPGLSWEEKKRVLMTYNHSEPYAETILEIAKNLHDSEDRN